MRHFPSQYRLCQLNSTSNMVLHWTYAKMLKLHFIMKEQFFSVYFSIIFHILTRLVWVFEILGKLGVWMPAFPISTKPLQSRFRPHMARRQQAVAITALISDLILSSKVHCRLPDTLQSQTIFGSRIRPSASSLHCFTQQHRALCGMTKYKLLEICTTHCRLMCVWN